VSYMLELKQVDPTGRLMCRVRLSYDTILPYRVDYLLYDIYQNMGSKTNPINVYASAMKHMPGTFNNPSASFPLGLSCCDVGSSGLGGSQQDNPLGGEALGTGRSLPGVMLPLIALQLRHSMVSEPVMLMLPSF
jgi:hypothetical protein